MCGIWAVIGRRATTSEADQAIQALHNRGPEGAAFCHVQNASLGFTRLAINGLTESGMQPMQHQDVSWVCNGEIYNWKELEQRLQLEHTSESDCSILGSLWSRFRQDPTTFFRALDGVFALIIVDEVTGLTTVARDPYGVRPLFYVEVGETLWFASEMKALMHVASHSTIQHVRPGTYMQLNTNVGGEPLITSYHTTPWLKNPTLSDPATAARALKDGLQQAVKKRLLTERPVAALLSGGIDSSLIAALVQKELKETGRTLETYTIGFEGSADLKYAREVAIHIGSDHTEILMTPQQFFDAIPEVIRDIESYDITTVRASVGNWLVSREISRLSEAKVLFNGDGSDEVFGSYLYFFRAPDHESYESEVTRLLEDIHKYDVLRSDRSISSHGLEPRTPFLDKQFVALARSIPTHLLRPVQGQQVEKALLRQAFNDGLLPLSVLHRQKEAFSDGVSGAKPWYKEIQERVDLIEARPRVYTHLSPQTPEAQYYRNLFDAIYGDEGAYTLSYFWMPKWSGETKDPSARTLSFYTANQ
jgi:asparagine synthase (glutamine-hydrolysing)